MVVNRILDQIFTNTGNLSVLRVLNERVMGISGRETARLSEISLRTAQIALNNLESLKIVKRQVGGREHLFTLNRDNFITKEIVSELFSAERRFKDSLFQIISKSLKELADSVIIFGSVARNEETPESDLDICIVYSKSKSKIEKVVSKIRDELYDTYGVTLAPFYITKKEFAKKARDRFSPVFEIINEGKVISGLSVNILSHG